MLRALCRNGPALQKILYVIKKVVKQNKKGLANFSKACFYYKNNQKIVKIKCGFSVSRPKKLLYVLFGCINV